MPPPFATPAAARTALGSTLSTLDALQTLALDVRARRRGADPTNDDPAYEGMRQRERALLRGVTEAQERMDYLLLALRNLEDDLAASPALPPTP